MPKVRPALKILLHRHAKTPTGVISSDSEVVQLSSSTCTSALWELAEKYPEEIIGWCEADLEETISRENWNDIFHHDLIMASYAVETTFLSGSIGYVDQLPFINVNRKVRYPTWLMSTDVGGIKGKVLLRFYELFGETTDFGFLLNSIAKVGQQNGLFCYSDPALSKVVPFSELEPQASLKQLFSFVYKFYSTSWIAVLFWCLWKYERKSPFREGFGAFWGKKAFKAGVDLSAFAPHSSKNDPGFSVDVIIPTLDRKDYLELVLEDLKMQSFLPKNVIIVEQDPEIQSQTQLVELLKKNWPFTIIHKFIHTTGACNARNLALDQVESTWVFFADDDIRLQSNLLEEVKKEVYRYRISAVNLNCKQPGEQTVFGKVKQWGSFGAGTSIVENSYAQKCRFSKIFEHGFGEDADFGMQLRHKGCDIIYHPDLQTQHLKAPTGGFRKKIVLPWEQELILPKPSPTLLAFAFKHYSAEQIKGYKVSLFLKFYERQSEKNPRKYIRHLEKRWCVSQHWARRLIEENKTTDKPPVI